MLSGAGARAGGEVPGGWLPTLGFLACARIAILCCIRRGALTRPGDTAGVPTALLGEGDRM